MAVVFALCMRALQLGTYDNMVRNSVEFYNGYIQIHNKGYWNDKTLNNSFEYNEIIEQEILAIDNVKGLIPRIEAFGLIASDENTKGGIILGIDIEKENQLTKVKEKIIEGRMPNKGANEIVIAENLAAYLGVAINDTVVILSQGYHSVNAAGKYILTGIIRYPNPQLNNSLSFLDYEKAAELFSMDGRLTSWVVNLEKHKKIKETAKLITEKLPENFEVMHWEEMLPELVQQIKSDNDSGLMILYILYIIIAFGIFGTVLMMTAERKKEFAVMVALGLQKTKLCILIAVESFYIVILGVLGGVLSAVPIIYYFHIHPLRLGGEMKQMIESYGMEATMPVSWEIDYFITQSAAVFILTIFAVAYPLLSLLRINAVKEIRN
jgi:ABC-type lipoprotein release transport system permease subunit